MALERRPMVHGARAGKRDAHDAALLGQRLQDGLPDPPHGVGDELDPLGLVELPRRADEADVSLVDEVGQRHALVLVLLGHRHHEAQVAAHQRFQRVAVAFADSPREPRFLVAVDQRIRADLAQVLVQRLGFGGDLLGGAERHWRAPVQRNAGTAWRGWVRNLEAGRT